MRAQSNRTEIRHNAKSLAKPARERVAEAARRGIAYEFVSLHDDCPMGVYAKLRENATCEIISTARHTCAGKVRHVCACRRVPTAKPAHDNQYSKLWNIRKQNGSGLAT